MPTMPIRTVTIPFDEIGYEGWSAELRLNVRARTYDDFLSQEPEKFWAAFSSVVQSWNFVDEDGNPLPLPKDGLGSRDLPIDLLNTMMLRYVEAMANSAAIPKARDEGSEITSRTNGAAPSTGAA